MRATKFIEQKDARFSLRNRAPVIWPWILVTAAWTVALLAVLTKQTYLINHSYLLRQSHLVWIVALVGFLAGFQVMIVAMMVPSSMPLVCIVVYASRRQQYPWMIQGAFVAGYALVWTAFACVAFLTDTLVHWLVSNWFWLYMHSWFISAATFAIAGGFQFSSLKEHCLKQNRSPLSFFTRYYRKDAGACLRLGLRHGVFCLGGCWALMLVMFGIGTGSIVWMAVLTGVMVIEKTYPAGQRLSLVFGVLLLVLAALWLVHPPGCWLAAVCEYAEFILMAFAFPYFISEQFYTVLYCFPISWYVCMKNYIIKRYLHISLDICFPAIPFTHAFYAFGFPHITSGRLPK